MLYDPISRNTMGETAENVSERFKISREHQYLFELESQKKAAAAMAAGVFDEQIAPFPVPQAKGAPSFLAGMNIPAPTQPWRAWPSSNRSFTERRAEENDHGRELQRDEQGGSGLCNDLARLGDGPGPETPCIHRRVCLSRNEPAFTGIAPGAATRKVLGKTSLTLGDIYLIELNEAFASQNIACIRQLGLDPEKVNVNGVAIAFEDPISAAGVVILTELICDKRRRGVELATMCLGGGQAVALIVKNEG